MKKCTYCGREHPDQAVRCVFDGQLLEVISATGASLPASPKPPPQKSENGKYLSYDDVPWYRREPGLLAMFGVLLCSLVTIALCIICLTGDVYKNAYDEKGNLKVWGVGNKIAAILILALQFFIYWAHGQMNHK